MSSNNFRRATPFSSRTFRRVSGEGPVDSCKLMLISERPSEQDAHRGRMFTGPSGQYLDICLNCAGIDRSSIYLTNLVKDFRFGAKPSQSELARDHDELIGEILDHDPEIIGLVGGWSVEEVLRIEKAEMDKSHGVAKRVMELFGGEIIFSSLTSARADTDIDSGWIVIPLLHSSQANYSPESLPLIVDDYITLGKLLDGEIEIVSDEYTGREDYRIVSGGNEIGNILNK